MRQKKEKVPVLEKPSETQRKPFCVALLEQNVRRKLVLKAEQTGQRQDTPAGRGRVITQERRSQEDKRRHLTAKLFTVTLYFFARKKGTF